MALSKQSELRNLSQTIIQSQPFTIIQSQSMIMPKARRTHNLSFKLKIITKAEAVENNSEIAREYGISKSMACRWRKDQANRFIGENCQEMEDDGLLYTKVS